PCCPALPSSPTRRSSDLPPETMSQAAPAAGAVTPDWIVLKFGGTSVSRRERWDTIGGLMKRRAGEEGARVLVVVSAVTGVTNALDRKSTRLNSSHVKISY